MKDMLREKVESQLNKIESQVANGLEVSEEDISQTKTLLNNVISMKKSAGYTDEEIKAIEDRFAKATNRNLNNDKKYSIKYIAKSFKTKVAAAVLVGTMGVTAIACTASKEEEPVEPVAMMAEVPETKMADTMTENVQKLADSSVEASNDSLSVGINLSMTDELTEADKETYARIITSYKIVTDIDAGIYTRQELADMFSEKSNPSEDLTEAFFEYNTNIKEHLITVNNDNMLDYSYLYSNEKDIEVLNESERLIAAINEAESKDSRITAAKNWYSYVYNILTSTKGNIALSSTALDTLITHCEAFDILTSSYSKIEGAYIDDNLERYLNIGKNACLGIENDSSEIKVEDNTIENLKSEFRISFINKLNNSYDEAVAERALQLSLGNSLNSNNSFDNIIVYVKENIDLTKYNKIDRQSYIEKQKADKGLNAPAQKAKDDSEVSNGKGGTLSNSQLAKYGISPDDPNALDKLKNAVETAPDEVINSYNAESEKKVATDLAEFNAGYDRGLTGQPKESGRSDDYNNGYEMGKVEYENARKTHPSNPNTTYETISNGEEKTTESETVTETYTVDPSVDTTTPYIENNQTVVAPETPGTTFESIDGEETTTESEITEFDYTGAINDLKALRDSLSASIDDQYSSSRSI